MEEKKRPIAKGVYILPNLFTTASLFVAFMSVTLAIQGNFINSAYAILLSAFIDGLDGKVARLTHTSSQFGVEYDSLADLVAFGLAPSVLAWAWQLQTFGLLGIAISFLYVACAALRLARFNVGVSTTNKRFFIGLPSTAAGCTLAAFILFLPYLPDFMNGIVPGMTLILCTVTPLLMISRVRYFSFKEYGFVKEHPFRVLVGCMVFLALILSMPRLWFFLAIFTYIIAGIIYTYIVLPHKNRELLHRLSQLNHCERFDSSVDLFLPEGYIPSVGIGDQVFAGQTVVTQKAD